MMAKPGRNDPCPCGSGKKYKKCCLAKQAVQVASLNWLKMRRTEGELIHVLLKHADKYYGQEAVGEAWDEFSLCNQVPMDPDSQPELDTAFLPWFVFNWIPDNAGVDEAEHYPEMQVAMHYLENKNSRLDSFQRRFIAEICSQPYSFFVVTNVDPGKRLSLRDLLLGREISVHERQASATLRKGSIIYSRIIAMDDNSIMVGCAPTVIPPNYLNQFIDIRENMAKKFPNFDQNFLLEYDTELRRIYYDIREELYNPAFPQLLNTDDDPLQLTKLYYTLKCTPHDALDALVTLSMAKDADEFLHEGKFDNHGELVSIEFPWLKKGNKKHVGWDNTVMGHIIINGDQLTIDVNSQKRADAIKRKLVHRLGKRTVFRNAVIQSAEKKLEEIVNRPPDAKQESARAQSEELQLIPEIQEQLQEMAEQHWKAWLDTPLPALKEQTPREAAETKLGRERLEALLLQFEQRNESPQPFSPDVEALRQSLGMD
ncbi:MAG: SEC-C domain-containing protein [Proteobacteria bacterium]|nr:SEC-C domain-containing protein [Pseudomonadota bacterium]